MTSFKYIEVHKTSWFLVYRLSILGTFYRHDIDFRFYWPPSLGKKSRILKRFLDLDPRESLCMTSDIIVRTTPWPNMNRDCIFNFRLLEWSLSRQFGTIEGLVFCNRYSIKSLMIPGLKFGKQRAQYEYVLKSWFSFLSSMWVLLLFFKWLFISLFVDLFKLGFCFDLFCIKN